MKSKITLSAVVQWLVIGEQVFSQGSAAFSAVKAALAANGIAADTSELDAVIADAERRKAIAEAEAQG